MSHQFTEVKMRFLDTTPLLSPHFGLIGSCVFVSPVVLCDARSWGDGRSQLESCLANVWQHPAKRYMMTVSYELIMTQKLILSSECADSQCWVELCPKSLWLPVTVTPAERSSLCPVGETCSPPSESSLSPSSVGHSEACTQLNNRRNILSRVNESHI